MDDIYKTRQTLLKRVKTQQDNDAWKEFTLYYEKFFYFICRRMDLSHHDCEEVVQKVFLKLWKKLPEIDCSNFRRFRSWLFTLTKREATDFIRSRNSRSNNENKAGEEDLDKYTKPEVEESAANEWEQFVVFQAIENVGKNFSPQVMEIFKALHKGEDLDAVSDRFKMARGTVTVYKHRVLNAVCAEVRKLENDLR